MTGQEQVPESRPACALDLGWRVAELYALADRGAGAAPRLALLPAHDHLPAADRLELQVRAAAGNARRAGLPAAEAGRLESLVEAARAAPRSPAAADDFRHRIEACHIELDKRLWEAHEAEGKAYELGAALSDTWNRIARAEGSAPAERFREWRAVFAEERVLRMKRLLDDLQSRLDPQGVAVVSSHLDRWRDIVCARVRTAADVPAMEAARRTLRRQTIIWRQIVTGDKQPEAWLGRSQRARVRDEFAGLAWRRYRRPLPLALLAAGLVAALAVGLNLDAIGDWYADHTRLASGVSTVAVFLAGALGISRASVGLALRNGMRDWSRLLWDRALSAAVCEATLTAEELFPPPERHPRARRIARRLRAAVERPGGAVAGGGPARSRHA